MSEHTPGPWKVVGQSVISDSGIICNPPSGPIGELEANARLIAAAPDTLEQRNELLEALTDLISEVEALSYTSPDVGEWSLDNARGAIAKAKGE